MGKIETINIRAFQNHYEDKQSWTVEKVVLGTAAYTFPSKTSARSLAQAFACGAEKRRNAESDPDCIGRTVHSKNAHRNFHAMLKKEFR